MIGGYVDQTYQHNPAAIDWEGDSLSYEFAIPLSGVDLPAPNFFIPSQVGNQNGILSINAELGSLTWFLPEIAGDYVIAMRIKEHRNGQVISTVIRDYIITIKDAVNEAPTIVVPINEVTLQQFLIWKETSYLSVHFENPPPAPASGQCH